MTDLSLSPRNMFIIGIVLIVVGAAIALLLGYDRVLISNAFFGPMYVSTLNSVGILGWLLAGIGILLVIIGLILAMTQPGTSVPVPVQPPPVWGPCPNCAAPVSSAHHACPRCGFHLGARCASCGSPMRPGSGFCPACGKALKTEGPGP